MSFTSLLFSSRNVVFVVEVSLEYGGSYIPHISISPSAGLTKAAINCIEIRFPLLTLVTQYLFAATSVILPLFLPILCLHNNTQIFINNQLIPSNIQMFRY